MILEWVRDLVKQCRHAIKSWHDLDQRMPEVNRAFGKVREELAEVGLLDEGVYLDQIGLCVSPIPSRWR
ncbi:MAG: hypothetical protein E4G90_01935 [Gemmatimonadales bacterium]|nr:MAG: hypothetical protein E4G90_01935 [Gemmatimonadales bacterium]